MCRATRDKVCHTTKCARNEKEGLYARRKLGSIVFFRIRSRRKARPSRACSRESLVAGRFSSSKSASSNRTSITRTLYGEGLLRPGRRLEKFLSSRDRPATLIRELAIRGFPRRTPIFSRCLPGSSFSSSSRERRPGRKNVDTWMFKRDTRIYRGELEGITSCNGWRGTFRYRGDGCVFTGIATAKKKSEQEIGGRISIEGRDR